MRNLQQFDLLLSPTEYEEWQRGEGIWFRLLGPMQPSPEPIKEFQYTTTGVDERWWVTP